MCLSKAYVERTGNREIIMEEVASVKIEDSRLLLRNLFGEQKEIGAHIREIDFLSHSILLEDLEESSSSIDR